ncbi:MogA/MoaB family molybdenum cofactor biosynthesis protein [Natrialba asiatica]|uniref:Molybdenum cofactor synthesis protein n=1 Tax=Natrialba asiatica (strain ATCC 700177 / DSM 12278 / JCM 9576 / FERM P-10747 / NBRC 102637 / 172P1) TaxID=29540 RepID=M0AL60_NATA1|nr:molybdopterin-binding protein [Natrialba asiatica]ELY99289.1 molybdenum cofactor synthesis protein [Natrialba asiatica DSM 12278]
MNESTEPDPDTAAGGAETAAEPSSREHAEPLGVGMVTIADDRTLESDPAGEVLSDEFTQAGHEISMREHVTHDHDSVQSIVSRVIDRDDVDVVVTAGGTSVEPSDRTIEAVTPLLEKRLETFPELLTTILYEANGTRALAARTTAGVTDGRPVFCLPGNANAARLAATELIVPECRHLVELARSEESAGESTDAEVGNGNGNEVENENEDVDGGTDESTGDGERTGEDESAEEIDGDIQ